MSSSLGNGRVTRELPAYVTMPLLTKITQQSLDEDYRHVADRRDRTVAEGAGEVAGSGMSARRLRRGTAVAVTVFGLLITTAAVQTSRNASATASGREALVSEANRRDDQVADQQSRLRELREQTTALQTRLDGLIQDEEAAEARNLRLKSRTGFTAVQGPGVRIVVDDGPDEEAGRVRDEDLAILVDGLWNAGAEAISNNGRRLTALSPIRSSNVAIHVNNKPVNPPYLILALGDTSDLQSRFTDSTHGLEWLSLQETYGFKFDVNNEDSLDLPGARMPVLRSVRLAGSESTPESEEVTP
jgi:uncharacterized protein YlxW (UPF0749 family)